MAKKLENNSAQRYKIDYNSHNFIIDYFANVITVIESLKDG